jgi:hypothetical protein
LYQPLILTLWQPLILKSIEASAFSTWLRESSSVFAFYFILCLHTIGMVLLVGPSAAIDLRLLGVARDLPIAPMRKFFGIMYAGFALNVVSGTLLLVAYPTKAVTNPDFYIKLSLIALGMWTVSRLKSKVFGDATMSDTARMAQGAMLAKVSLVTWIAVITAGRLLAYTYTYLLYGAYAPGG